MEGALDGGLLPLKIGAILTGLLQFPFSALDFRAIELPICSNAKAIERPGRAYG